MRWVLLALAGCVVGPTDDAPGIAVPFPGDGPMADCWTDPVAGYGRLVEDGVELHLIATVSDSSIEDVFVDDAVIATEAYFPSEAFVTVTPESSSFGLSASVRCEGELNLVTLAPVSSAGLGTEWSALAL